MRYIALLRGINVGGQRSIKMADLKDAFESLGFSNVKTYVQSGNVVFSCEPAEPAKLAEQIESKLDQTFGFPVKTIIRTEDEFENIINNNPFVKERDIALDKLHVTLLSDMPEPEAIALLDIKKEENEKFLIISREVYLYCPNGYGNTKMNNAVFEKKLKTMATTRNWKTMNSLLELAKQDA